MTTSDSPFDTREMSEKRPEKIFEEITENSLIWEREYLLNLWKNITKNKKIKLKKKIKDKEKKKGTRGKHQIIYKGIPIILSADFSAETP